MGERTSHAPGTFSSVDLATSDGDAAESFYGGLFGWKFEDMGGAGGTYTIFRLDGKHVAGCFEAADGRPGTPPRWNSYITVQDVDASVARATELAGSVLMEAQDVAQIGRAVGAARCDRRGARQRARSPVLERPRDHRRGRGHDLLRRAVRVDLRGGFGRG